MKNLLLLIFFFNFLLLDSKKTYSIGKDSNKLNLLMIGSMIRVEEVKICL